MPLSYHQFNSQTESKEVVDAFADSIKGKTIVVTGVSPNGLGEETAKALASQKPGLLVLTGRSPGKVETVRATLKQLYPEVQTRPLQLDLASFESVRAAAAELTGPNQPNIDILINNAGVMMIATKQLSADGLEMQFATNHLGPFLFTELIKPKLTAGGGARIVNVSSYGYLFQGIRFSDYNFDGKPLPEAERPDKAWLEQNHMPYTEDYTPVTAYAQSKTANILHAIGLNKRYAEEGITAIAIHPGTINTDLWRHMPQEAVSAFQSSLAMKSISQGSSTQLVAALDPKLTGHPITYMSDCQEENTKPFANDPALAEKLWVLSEEITGPKK